MTSLQTAAMPTLAPDTSPPASPRVLEESAAAEDADAFGEHEAWHRLRVLVVEDNSDLREMIASYLREEGLDVVTVPSAELGLKRLRSERFAAVLTDYTLKGGETGAWLIRQACEQRLLRAENFVVLTAHRSLTSSKGVRVLQKPYDLVSLRVEVDAACEG